MQVSRTSSRCAARGRLTAPTRQPCRGHSPPSRPRAPSPVRPRAGSTVHAGGIPPPASCRIQSVPTDPPASPRSHSQVGDSRIHSRDQRRHRASGPLLCDINTARGPARQPTARRFSTAGSTTRFVMGLPRSAVGRGTRSVVRNRSTNKRPQRATSSAIVM